MEESDHPQAETRCPLCGKQNQCAVAAGQAPETCWCQTAVMDTAALDRARALDATKSCLCPACGQRQGDSFER